MITETHISDFGKIQTLDITKWGPVNLVIGTNGTGKTFLLKSLYCAYKTLEDFKKGNDNRTMPEILADYLRWCFQTEKLGELVRKGSTNLAYSMRTDDNTLNFSFSCAAEKKIVQLHGLKNSALANSVFIPAKEVLSLFDIIQQTAIIEKRFGFDRTYSDLVQALKIAPHRGKNHYAFRDARLSLEGILGGKAEYDETKGKWFYRENKNKFNIGIASEGIKKISILDRLLANGYISDGSVIFIDEIEAALHPEAISKLIDMICDLALRKKIQFFISTHSYHAVKCLYINAKRNNIHTPCISFTKQNVECEIGDLSQFIPSNPIIDESIRIFEEEIDL